MGNQLAQPTKLQPEHLAELNDVVLKSMLGAQSSAKAATSLGRGGRLSTFPNALRRRSGLTNILGTCRGWSISEDSALRA